MLELLSCAQLSFVNDDRLTLSPGPQPTIERYHPLGAPRLRTALRKNPASAYCHTSQSAL